MAVTGHCLCGATKLTADIDIKDATVGFDHCDACQRQTGSAFSLVVVAPRDKVKITGDVKDYAKPGDSGKDVHRIFCGTCGSPMAHAPDAAKDIIAIKGGILDSSIKKQLPTPAIDIYTQDKLPLVTQEADKAFKGMPE
ncbi:hypothetical protein P389DRAFT_80609 [Cystobasidium minutum MCA 4210]|uniref:uncharacterized protein n=1 Tax=Cystobasidium minutum MCA 4210 TaxID=1397322 RepID=UPI0034CD0A04|eukprot:jgi/Rhomi1/80609/CE80608_5378